MPIEIQDENGDVHTDPSPATLQTLMQNCEQFVVVENTDLGEGRFAQAAVFPEDRSWQVEVFGNTEGPVQTHAADTESAAGLLRAWAAGDDSWRQLAEWSRLDL